MPILGAPLDFAKLEGRNFRAHQLGAAPASPVTGQLYYDTAANVLYYWNGRALISAAGGAPPDATASAKGVVQLAGDLAGTAAAPTIAASAVTSAKIADGTITDVDVAAANKDGVVGLASLRTLGAGAQQAMPGNRTLDAVTAPAADVNLNTHKLTNVVDPTVPTDAATKNYVDATAQGLDAKASVKAASTANLTLSAAQTVDGIALVAGDRILVKDQTTPSQNGIYLVAAGAWTRALDADAWTELPGAFTFVETGTVNADTGWVCTADQGGTIGTTSVTWTQFSAAGTILAGAGLLKTGTTIDLQTLAGGGLTVAADTVVVDATVARYYSSSTHGAVTAWTITQATHGCHASRGLIVQVHDMTSGAWEIPDVTIAANGDVTITYAAAVAANSKMVTIIG
jgi:hypothetical protein